MQKGGGRTCRGDSGIRRRRQMRIRLRSDESRVVRPSLFRSVSDEGVDAVVTVVLPVRNAAGTLTRALASLRAQTLTDWNAWLVDDGSTDGTPQRLHEAAANDERFRVIEQPALGLVAALNVGLAAAEGSFVA